MKLTLDALKERADAVASEELLNSISGGTENACHDTLPEPVLPHTGNPIVDPITGLIWWWDLLTE